MCEVCYIHISGKTRLVGEGSMDIYYPLQGKGIARLAEKLLFSITHNVTGIILYP